MRSLYTLLFIVFSIASAYANDLVLSGTVVDEQNVPVPYANAALYNTADSTLVGGGVTDESGDFAIDAPAGTYYLVVSFVSYQTKTVRGITLDKDLNLGSVQIQSDAQVLDAIVVEGERSQMEFSLDKRVFHVGKDLSNISGNAAEVLDNVPSVSIDVDGNINLRGSQNVRILINGRPSSLTGINVADAMRQLQGNMIERVEIITNPSSRYDAEGEVGIINIILRKEKSTTGTFSVNAGYPDNFGGSFNLNIRKKKFNYFGGYGVSYRSSPGSGNSFQSFIQSDTSFSYNQLNDRTRSGISHNARAGVDFTLPGGGTITASGLARLSDGLNKTTNVYDDFAGSGDHVRRVIRTEREEEPETNLEGALSYRKEFDENGRLLTIDAKWIDNRETERASFEQTDLLIDSVGFQRSMNTENERNFLAQADYVHPFGEKAKIEGGLKTTRREIGNNFLVEQLDDEQQQWNVLPQLNNNLIYTEQIHAAYTTIGQEIGKFSWQAGARVEMSDIDVELVNSGESHKQRYTNVFPSAHLSYNYKRDRTLQLSYSYRLSRPGFRALAPFSNYSDNRSVSIGNPTLRPEYTHSLEGGHLWNWDIGSLLTGIYHRYRTGVIERIASVDSLGVTSSMPVNLATEKAYGAEINLTLNPVQWWRLNGNANFYRATTEGDYADQYFYADTYTMTSRLTSQFTVRKVWNAQVGFNYRAPRVTTQGRDLALYYADLGLSRDILKGNGTLTLSVRDVFNTRKYRSIIEREDVGYRSERTFQWRARQFLLTFSYRLNMQKSAGQQRVDDDSEFDQS